MADDKTIRRSRRLAKKKRDRRETKTALDQVIDDEIPDLVEVSSSDSDDEWSD